MKKITLSLIIILISSYYASCQDSIILNYFQKIKNDSIINTIKLKNGYFKKLKNNSLSDSLALKYFFGGNTEKMYGQEQGYNVDNNTYTTVSFVKKVCPLFFKEKNNNYLLFYGIESALYVGIYDRKEDTILYSQKVSDFSDELGNNLTHSMIFPTNYIVSIIVGKNTKYKLIEIDLDKIRFIVLKDVEKKNNIFKENKSFKEAMKILNITQEGTISE